MSGMRLAKSVVYVILPEMMDEHRGYELGVVWPGIIGIHGAERFFGFDEDLARETAAEMNMANGITPEEATQAVENAMQLHRIFFFGV